MQKCTLHFLPRKFVQVLLQNFKVEDWGKSIVSFRFSTELKRALHIFLAILQSYSTTAPLTAAAAKLGGLSGAFKKGFHMIYFSAY